MKKKNATKSKPAKYCLHLPTEEELATELQREVRMIEEGRRR